MYSNVNVNYKVDKNCLRKLGFANCHLILIPTQLFTLH